MKKLMMLFIFSGIFMTGCAIHIPGPYFEDDYFPVSVRLDINPDDAEVYLDGRLIGEAYEFSSSETAIRLSSGNHRLTLRRDGYYEMVTDLDEYRDRHILLRLNLRTLPAQEKTPLSTQTAADAEQTAPPPPPKPEDEGDEPSSVERYALFLTVSSPEATIYINDRFWGIAPQGGQIGRIVFTQKEIKIDILKPGFKPWQKKISLTEEGEKLEVILDPLDK